MKTVVKFRRQSILKFLMFVLGLGLISNAHAQTATNIGDLVWLDTDADGIQDVGESGLSGVTVELHTMANVLVDTDVTDGSGNYTLTKTITGSEFLKITFTLPAGYSFSDADETSDDLDSDPVVTTGVKTTSVSEGVDVTNLDAGMFRKGTFHGHLYQDENNSWPGTGQDVGEADMNNVEIAITDKDGFTTTVHTDASGDWTAQIVPGSATYDIVEATSSFFDNGYVHNEGAGAFTFNVPEGGTQSAGNDGFFLHAMVGDYVWRDVNMDGVQDVGETGLSGIVVHIYNPNNGYSVFTSVTSDVNGYYEFTDLEPDDYQIDISVGGLPAGYGISTQDQGGDDTKDSDIDSGGITALFSILSGSTNDHIDIGLYKLGSIQSRVWWDLDDDGIQDAGETGVSNVAVTLYESDGTTVNSSTTTDASGDYTFSNIEPDDYIIGITKPAGYDFAQQNQGGDDTKDSDHDVVTGKTATITISEGEDDVDEDCGLVGTGTVTCFVWEDTNGNGAQDVGENGIDGATVELFDDTGVTLFKTGITAGGGNKTFNKLNPRDFKLKFTKPATYDNFTAKDQGGDDTKDSDADIVSGFTDAFTLAAGGTKSDLGCGAHKNVTIDGKVWIDDNSNGLEDGVEAGEDGVDVELYLDGAGVPDETITTPAGGLYSFTGKKPGTHRIKFKKKNVNHRYCPKDQGGDDTVDSDADQSTGFTDNLIMTSGSGKHHVNCGQMRPLDIEVAKVVDDATPDPGDPIVFTITVTNHSATQTSTNLVVAEVLNTTAFTYDAGNSSVSQGSWPVAAGPWNVGTLAPGVTATMNIGATFNSNGDNTASFNSQDQVETNAANNSGTASVTDGSSGGGGGGIESDGSMSEQIALRDFMRFKNNTGDMYDVPEKLIEYREHDVKSGLIVPASKLKASNSGILEFIPEQGPINTKAHIVTPEDLLYLSNAEEVFSVDYFEADETRLAALMAMTTPPGEVYNHTKMICDRLTGGSLEMLRYMDIKDQPFILGLIKQSGGEADYFISFVVYEENGTWVVDNQWSKEWYTPSTDKQVFNFQIWSVSAQMTVDLGNEVLSRFQDDNGLVFKNDGSQQIPDVFVKNGTYNNGNLYLTIQNRVKASSVTVSGKLTRAEHLDQERFEYTLPINTSIDNQIIEVPVGYLYDAGFVLENNANDTKDELYFADGSWSKYIAENSGSIDNYEVVPHFNTNHKDGEYALERGAKMSGTVKSYVSLFRAIGLRNTPVNLENLNTLEFTASGQGVVEVIVTKSSVKVWSNQFRKTINLTSQEQDYQLAFDEFKNSDRNSWFTGEDVVSVIFNIVGDNNNYTAYDIDVKNLKFSKQDNSLLNDKLLGISSFPNPFVNQTTFTVKMEEEGSVRIMLFDMLGQEVDVIAEQELPSGISYIDYRNDGLKAGTYFCKLYFGNYSETIKVTVSR